MNISTKPKLNIELIIYYVMIPFLHVCKPYESDVLQKVKCGIERLLITQITYS